MHFSSYSIQLFQIFDNVLHFNINMSNVYMRVILLYGTINVLYTYMFTLPFHDTTYCSYGLSVLHCFFFSPKEGDTNTLLLIVTAHATLWCSTFYIPNFTNFPKLGGIFQDATSQKVPNIAILIHFLNKHYDHTFTSRQVKFPMITNCEKITVEF